MVWFDLLYPSEKKWEEEKKQGGRVSPRLAYDLQLDRLVKDNVLDRDEYAQLSQELEYLPIDRKVVLFRQAVLGDLMRNPHFLDKCGAFCAKLKNNVPVKRNIWDPPVPVYKNLEEQVGVLEANYQSICTTDLGAATAFRTEALMRLAYFFESDEYKGRLREVIKLLKELLASGAVRYRPEYAYGQVMESMVIQDVYRENFYVMREKGLLKKPIIDKDYLIPADNIILENNMEEIYSKTIVKLCDFVSKLNSTIVNTFRRIQRELPYYRAGIRLHEMYRRLGCQVCLPQVEEGYGASMEFCELYPVHLLAGKSLNEIQTNSYSNKEGRTAIVTGYNSGGKTTFLQAVGIAQIMMQFGFFVPAASYQASIVPFIGSLFSRSEDIDTIYGKLEQELMEVKNVAGRIEAGSLLLINEIFGTTSEKEGTEIAAEVLCAFSRTHSHMIFVTHLKYLADMVQEQKLALAEGEHAVNYVTEQFKEADGRLKKTYRIRKGCPEPGIFEKELFDKYYGKALWKKTDEECEVFE